ncbi:hypothetical protein QFC22_001854 [Naganishia vaughanmartiniae]|uniref:Uncharacterized protein n=1 Tax=Naganishia vaughanmartiniae TaxID=1424756 RepID=A0ACC2XGA4_9TREE|nr:hypothetical protein QFC22_001854 [Naganishia vaughanmartiniae]
MLKSSCSLIRQASQRGCAQFAAQANNSRALSSTAARLADQAEDNSGSKLSRMQELLLEIPPELNIPGMSSKNAPQGPHKVMEKAAISLPHPATHMHCSRTSDFPVQRGRCVQTKTAGQKRQRHKLREKDHAQKVDKGKAKFHELRAKRERTVNLGRLEAIGTAVLGQNHHANRNRSEHPDHRPEDQQHTRSMLQHVKRNQRLSYGPHRRLKNCLEIPRC